MKRQYLVIAMAWLLHAASWFLTAIKIFDVRVQGWEAFLQTVWALWPSSDATFESWYGRPISAISVISTPLFVLVSPWIVWRGSRKLRRAAAVVASGAFVVNSFWYVLYGSDRSSLGVGYFFWCTSFALMAIGLFWLSGKTNVADVSTPSPKVDRGLAPMTVNGK